ADVIGEHGPRIVARCVDGETGAPLAGVRARVERQFAPGEWEQRDAWSDPEAVTSGPDGRVRIGFAEEQDDVVSGTYRLICEAGPSRAWPTTIDELRFEPGSDGSERLDVGDVRLYRTVLLLGRVVDKKGRPLPGIGLRFDRIVDSALATRVTRHATADCDGRFHVHLER